MTGSPVGELDRYIEAANHASGQYITRGPSIAPEQMSIVGLERVRARLAPSPLARHHHVAGWVAVEQAFATAAHPVFSQKFSTDPLFAAAENSFALALDRYDETLDDPDHTLRVRLDIASLAIYRTWLDQTNVSAQTMNDYHGQVIEIGRSLLDHADHLRAGDAQKGKTLNGLVGELTVQLAYNRRQLHGSTATTLAVPSTYRQNASRHMGTVGSHYDRAYKGSNWDHSVIELGADGWQQRDKLQVKTVLSLPDTPNKYGKQAQDYTDDITLVGVREHLLRLLPGVDGWEALRLLTGAGATGSPAQQKRMVSTITRELYDYIDWDRQRRAALPPGITYPPPPNPRRGSAHY